jgi:uncharacterized protein DUF642
LEAEAQGFQAAFQLDADDKPISVVDEGGVALAAIQGLNQKLEEARAGNAELKQRLEALEKPFSIKNQSESSAIMKIKSTFVVTVLALRIHHVHAGLLANGSFEAATNAATLDYISLSPGSTNIPGWTTTNAELTWDGPLLGTSISPTLTAAQGSDFLDLTGVHDAPPYGAVFQTMTTTIGQQYQVSFELGSDTYWDSYYGGGTFTAPVVAVSLNGVVAFSATNNFPTFNNYWQTWSFYFTAGATNTTLMFTGANTGPVAYIGLDNVMVTGIGPPLVILLSAANSVVVSWPDTGSYTLQTNNNLAISTWGNYSGTVTNSNGTNSITITPPTGNLFFRLADP